MLSILIPTYNFNCLPLVESLQLQAEQLGITYEIIVIDDHSTTPPPENTQISTLPNCRYIELPENIGRAKIRNMLAEKAQHENLLFLDCDMRLPADDFLKRYSAFCNEGEMVICGGLRYATQAPSDKRLYLHWLYGQQREIISIKHRQRHPYHAFLSSNFFINKSLFNKIKFDEQLKKYGHEDSLFGIRLKELNATILHIDNPLIHIGLETSCRILEKERESIANLVFIYQHIIKEEALAQEIKLLRYGLLAKKIGANKLILSLFNLLQKPLLRNIESRRPNLLLLDFYKLGYLCKFL
ncbi:MAG: glycosyltransferase [Prevotellaceae bacterium]|jgi:glycosyltransferase involved in cell wall biosynthesis|nr:glycosyltransferase [Prevotellaceae bacterium]